MKELNEFMKSKKKLENSIDLIESYIANGAISFFGTAFSLLLFLIAIDNINQDLIVIYINPIIDYLRNTFDIFGFTFLLLINPFSLLLFFYLMKKVGERKK